MPTENPPDFTIEDLEQFLQELAQIEEITTKEEPPPPWDEETDELIDDILDDFEWE